MRAPVMRAAIGLSAVLWSSLFFVEARSSASSPAVGDPPPALLLSRIVQGPALEEVTWKRLQGKVVILEFWNTACLPCVEAIPHWNQLVDDFRRQPVVFLSVSDDNEDHLKRFLRQRPIKGWLVLDRPFKPTHTAFGVVAIPHTVIVDPSGKIAAVTHPARLKAGHIEEILAGRPSTLPARNISSTAEPPTVPVSNSPPSTIEISIEGPFPRPDGAFGLRGWKQDYAFHASKASLTDVLSEFFKVSPVLIFEQTTLPEGLYDISAASPPDKLHELKSRFIGALRDKWKIDVRPASRDVSVYAMTVCATNAPGLQSVPKRGGGGQKRGGFSLGGQPMAVIASYLEGALGKPVVDETGLRGLWAADVKWEMTEAEVSADAAPDPARVIKAAGEQLGLELRPALRSRPVLEIRKPGD